MRDAKTTRQSASETDYIRLISRWLDGGPWEGVSRYYDAARGLRIKLEENGDALTQGGVAIITRNPTRLPDLSAGIQGARRPSTRTTMTDLTMAAKAHTAVINLAPPGPPRAEAVTAVAVNGVPVAFTIATGGIRLAEPLAADATVTLTYDPANPRAGALEHRLLSLANRIAALEAR
jgi:hypothetical protein